MSVGVTAAGDVGVAPVVAGTTGVVVGSAGFAGAGEGRKLCNPKTSSRLKMSTTPNIAAMRKSIRPRLLSGELDRATGRC